MSIVDNSKSDQELNDAIFSLRKGLLEEIIGNNSQKVDKSANYSRFKVIRKEIARAYTILRERELQRSKNNV